MHDDELWQVFAQNGEPISDRGAIDDAFDNDTTMVVGNAHVWFWKKSSDGVMILLQKRALTKKKAPGYYHISAGGHINVGETAVEAAVRETGEEMGVMLDPARLYLVYVTRTPRNWQDLAHVYAYELQGDETFSFDDGEVELVKWVELGTFQQMTQEATTHKLVDQGRSYFDPLIETIKRLSV
jgi:8-oxo-dGTP pyrophosphatase MutT (NUDIX family)